MELGEIEIAFPISYSKFLIWLYKKNRDDYFITLVIHISFRNLIPAKKIGKKVNNPLTKFLNQDYDLPIFIGLFAHLRNIKSTLFQMKKVTN